MTLIEAFNKNVSYNYDEAYLDIDMCVKLRQNSSCPSVPLSIPFNQFKIIVGIDNFSDVVEENIKNK